MFRIISKSYILSNKLLLGRIDTEIYRRHLFSYFLYSLSCDLFFLLYNFPFDQQSIYVHKRHCCNTYMCNRNQITSNHCVLIESVWVFICFSVFSIQNDGDFNSLFLYQSTTNIRYKCVTYLNIDFFCCYTFVFANVMSCRANWCEERKWVAVRK